jgi:uncharacterized protein (TIGR00725 family)
VRILSEFVEGFDALAEIGRAITIVGSARVSEGDPAYTMAREIGRLLALEGYAVITGGGPGVMEAVARGAASVGGTVVGILPGADPGEANPHCTHAVATGVGQARNLAVVASGEATIAVGGEWGTLAEIAHARNLGRPVIALRSWGVSGVGDMDGGPGVSAVSTPEEAVAAALGH